MIIKYYGFNKQFLNQEVLAEETVLPENICGYEIYDDGVLQNSCFQGEMIKILDIMSKENAIMNIFPEKVQSDIRTMVDKCFKEHTTEDFIINVKGDEVSVQEVIPCQEASTFKTQEQLEVMFNLHKHNCLNSGLKK